MDRVSRYASQSPKRFQFWLISANLLVALLLCLATYWNLKVMQASDLARAHEAADNLAHSVGVEVGSELRLLDNALVTVAHRLAEVPSSDGESLSNASVAIINEQLALVPFAQALRFATPDGKVRSQNTGGAPISIADRDYFHRVLQSDGVVVSDPLMSRVLGEWCVIVSRRVVGSDHQVRGVVYAVVTSRHLEGLFSKLTLADGGVLALRNEQFKLLARYSSSDPNSTYGIGEAYVSAELRRLVGTGAASGLYRTVGAQDKVERVYAFRRVPGFALILIAGLNTANYVDPWHGHAVRHWMFSGSVILLLVVGSGLFYAQHRRVHEAMVVAASLAKQQELIIENDWVGMIRLHNRRIVWVNRAINRILGYTEQELLGRTTRKFYQDPEMYDVVGDVGYRALREHGSFHTQVKLLNSKQETVWVDMSGTTLSEEESVWMVVDIDRLKDSETHAYRLALHDALTGLANRRLFDEQLRHVLAQTQRDGGHVAVCYIDLDGFKPINDTFGHDAGDVVLCQVATRMAHVVRANDLVARLGGDEFALVLSSTATEAEAHPILVRCLEAVRQSISLPNGEDVRVGCSIGVVFADGHATDPHVLLAAADKAMYLAKQSGKGRIYYAA